MKRLPAAIFVIIILSMLCSAMPKTFAAPAEVSDSASSAGMAQSAAEASVQTADIMAQTAAEVSAQTAADILYELGLFRGTGTDASGKPIYDLEAVPTRGQAIVMLIRLLGAEHAALIGEWNHPFNDVAQWADPYVGYAYEKGLTLGVSATAFGTNSAALPNMYLTFVLRALGYSDSGPDADFAYSDATAFAAEIGLYAEAGLSSGTGLSEETFDKPFLRGDLAVISFNALNLTMKNSPSTLIQFLVDNGAVDAGKAANQGFSITPPAAGQIARLTAHWDYSDPANPDYYYADVSIAAIKAAFPGATGLLKNWMISSDPNIYYSNTFTYNEMLFLNALGNAYDITTPGYPAFSTEASERIWNFYNGCAYIIDDDYNILGICYAADQEFSNGDVVVNKGGDGVNGALIYSAINAKLDKAMKNYNSAKITIADTGYDPLGEGGNKTYTYPAYLDGDPLGKDSYILAFSIAPRLATESGFSAYNQIRKSMFDVLFMSDGSLRYQDGSVENFYYSDFSSRRPYSETAGSAQVHYGVRLYESRSTYTFIFAFGLDGAVLGYTMLPPTA